VYSLGKTFIISDEGGAQTKGSIERLFLMHQNMKKITIVCLYCQSTA
jgi:hypothetical protein